MVGTQQVQEYIDMQGAITRYGYKKVVRKNAPKHDSQIINT
jgi:hypothetical protein